MWLMVMALTIAMWWRRVRTNKASHQLFILSLFFLATAFGILRAEYFETKFTDRLVSLLGTEHTFVGEVVKEPDRRSNVQMLTVRYQDTNIRVSTDRVAEVGYGDVVEVTGLLKRPESFTTELGRTFNYAGYLRAKEIEYVVNFGQVTVLDNNQGNPIVSGLLQVKQYFMQQLDSVFTEPAGALADGLLLGLNQGLGEKLETDFRRSGIIHIVVLSGYNVMLVVSFVMFLLAFLLSPRWRLLAGLFAIASFVLIVGPSATVLRAGIMASLLLVAQTFGRSYDVLRALLIAGFFMLLINPYLLLFDIGFQLSFMATLGLIIAIPWLEGKEQPEVLTSVRGYVVATVATQIAVLPLLMYHIGEVSLVAVLVNVLVLPVVPFAMLGAFLAALSNVLVPSLGLLIGFLTQQLLSYIIVVAEVFSSLPFATLQFPDLSAWWVGSMYFLLGYCYWWLVLRQPPHSQKLIGWQIVTEESITKDVDQRSTSQKASI
jgi:competence protein ComEC